MTLAYGNDTGGYDADDPKSSGWYELDRGARLQRHLEEQEQDR